MDKYNASGLIEVWSNSWQTWCLGVVHQMDSSVMTVKYRAPSGIIFTKRFTETHENVRHNLDQRRASISATLGVISDKGCQCITNIDGQNIDVPAPYWGITLSEIKNFMAFCKTQCSWHDSMSVRNLVDGIIKPNYRSGQSVALTDKRVPTRIRWLVSHCWEESAGEFLNDLISLLETKAAPDEGIFVCFLCVYQGSEDEITAQVAQGSDNIDEGCFATILESVKACKGAVCVIPNETLLSRNEGLYSRLWCGWEAYQAKERNVKIVILPTKSDPKYFFGTGDVNQYTLRNGTCGNPRAQNQADKLNENQIRNAIESRGGWNGVDTRIKIAVLDAIDRYDDGHSVLPFLSDRNELVLAAALLTLQKFGEAAAPHADELAKLVGRSPHTMVDTLLTMGSAGVSCVTRLMFSEDESIQKIAVEGMREWAAQRAIVLKQHDDFETRWENSCRRLQRGSDPTSLSKFCKVLEAKKEARHSTTYIWH